jgi:hypothetical protein
MSAVLAKRFLLWSSPPPKLGVPEVVPDEELGVLGFSWNSRSPFLSSKAAGGTAMVFPRLEELDVAGVGSAAVEEAEASGVAAAFSAVCTDALSDWTTGAVVLVPDCPGLDNANAAPPARPATTRSAVVPTVVARKREVRATGSLSTE